MELSQLYLLASDKAQRKIKFLNRGSHIHLVEISAAVDEEPVEGLVLNFRTPVLDGFGNTSKKALYNIFVKVSHYNVLKDCKETK